MKKHEYRVRYQTTNKERLWKLTFANTAQEAADNIRREVEGCQILVVALVVENWK